MSVVRSTALARSSPPSADERLATGGPSGRRGAGGSCANVPFSGTVNARGSREAMSIRMAREGGGGPNPSPTRDRARHAPPVVPTRRFGVRHECAFDDRHPRGYLARHHRAAPCERPLRPGRRERAARRRGRLVRGDACSRARAFVPAASRREASRVLGFGFPANASLGEEKCREATPKNPAGKLWCSESRAFRGIGTRGDETSTRHALTCSPKKSADHVSEIHAPRLSRRFSPW